MAENTKDLLEPVPTSPRIDRKLVVILAADVMSFSSHMERDEEQTLSLLTSRRKLIDQLIDTFEGRITGTAGDSVVAEFASVVNAVDCAVQIQKSIIAANRDEQGHDGLSFRIGVNVGDVMVKDSDIFGDGVNVAARLETLSEPDGVCISRGVHEYVRKQTSYVYEDLGEQRVKNIAQPLRAFRILFRDGAPVLTNDGPSKDPVTPAEMELPEYELTFWETIKDSDNPDEFEAYLERYPQGSFAPIASARIKALSERETGPETPEADPVELAYWESVKDSANVEMFRAYLATYPEGAFADLAKIQIGELDPR